MTLRYWINVETNDPHIYDHRVTESEVEDVLFDPGEVRNGDDGSKVAIGQTQAGRYLKVAFVPDDDGDGVFVITAYDLTGKPLAAYHRRKKRTNK